MLTKHNPTLAYQVKKSNHWRCERCNHKLDNSKNLTIYPLDGNPENNEPWNLAALCPSCLKYIRQFGLEVLLLVYDSPGIFGNNEPWLKSHIAGIKEAVQFGVSPITRGETIPSSHHSNLLGPGARAGHNSGPW